MNSRRWVIVLAVVGVLHNALRVIASILGSEWGYFNYLPLRTSKPFSGTAAIEIAGVLAVVAAVVWLAAGLWRNSLKPSPVWSSVIWAMGAGTLVGLVAVYATMVARSYGWILFVVTPFVMGVVSVLALAQWREVTMADALTMSTLAVVTLGVLLVAFAIEGIICLSMAIPIAIPIAILGGVIACFSQRRLVARTPMLLLVVVTVLPFGTSLESALRPAPRLFTVTTSIDIPVAPGRVWRTILQPAKLAPPSHFLFRSGIAYPLASHIEGSGLTATRYCDFSTGKLVEPVLIWDEGRRLRFTVVSNPLPLQEWTPYARIHPPHLEGFLASRQGEFRIEPLANGGTRLYATTWYQHHMWPAEYWRFWSDYIIHRVHDMVLENVRQRAEASAPAATFYK